MATGSHIKKSKGKSKSGCDAGVLTTPCSVNAQIVVVILLLCTTIAVIIAFYTSFTNSITSLEDEVSLCQAESPTEQDIYACFMSQCTFDVSLCSEECPFGYAKDETNCQSECTCADEGIFEGDIMFDEDHLPDLISKYGYVADEGDFATFSGSGTSFQGALFDDDVVNGKYRVMYTIPVDLPDEALKSIKAAIAKFHEKTCILFEEVPLGYEKSRIAFRNTDYCASAIGRIPRNPILRVSTSRRCTTPHMQHELLHALGFYHEQSRPDRDAYVELFEENMKLHYKRNFRKVKREKVLDLKSEYELTSIMHYRKYAFTKNWRPTIDSRSGEPIGRKEDFTERDLEELSALYNCPSMGSETAQPKWNNWESWGPCDVTCGKGMQKRFRKCFASNGMQSLRCEGSSVERKWCTAVSCSGGWGNWGSFSACTKTCGLGYKWKSRYCIGYCTGNMYSVENCNMGSCKMDAMWAPWSKWSSCRATCGSTIATRGRICKSGQGAIVNSCSGENNQLKVCNMLSCESYISNWGSWSQCSATCDGYRRRKCTGLACRTGEEVDHCATRPCKEPDIFAKTRQGLDIDEVCNAAFTMDNWVFGDFNGDKRMDVICADLYGVYQMSYGSGNGKTNVWFNTVWSGSFSQCIEGTLLVGDVNGDRRNDLICKSKHEGRLFIKYSSTANLQEEAIEGGDFCTEYTSKLTTVPNFHPTGLLCHFGDNRVEMIFAKE